MSASYTLSEHFEAFVKELVKSGRYDDVGEVIRDGLRLLEDRERERALRIDGLRRLSEEGRLSGLSDEDGETVLDRLEAKYRQLADAG